MKKVLTVLGILAIGFLVGCQATKNKAVAVGGDIWGVDTNPATGNFMIAIGSADYSSAPVEATSGSTVINSAVIRTEEGSSIFTPGKITSRKQTIILTGSYVNCIGKIVITTDPDSTMIGKQIKPAN